jgi:hypothetical protein
MLIETCLNPRPAPPCSHSPISRKLGGLAETPELTSFWADRAPSQTSLATMARVATDANSDPDPVQDASIFRVEDSQLPMPELYSGELSLLSLRALSLFPPRPSLDMPFFRPSSLNPHISHQPILNPLHNTRLGQTQFPLRPAHRSRFPTAVPGRKDSPGHVWPLA